MNDVALVTVRLTEDADVLAARQRAATIALCCNLTKRVATAFATAVSEIARNAVRYANHGSATFALIASEDDHLMLLATISDSGPGLTPERVAQIHGRKPIISSTGLGVGLVGARRLVDAFTFDSGANGTVVTLGMIVEAQDGVRDVADLARYIADEVANATPPDPYQELARQNRELVDALAHAREQEAAGRMLIGIVSHDLRSPLAVVAMSTQLILHEEGLDESLQKHAKRILRASKRADALIEDLLDFTRASLGRGIPVDCAPISAMAVIREAVSQSGAANPSALFEVNDTECQVVGDHDRLVQAMINLIRNAVEHGVEGKAITVTLRQDAGHCFFSVRNHIAPGTIVDETRMFTPLKKGKTSSGLGLGMYIVKEIANAHDGTCVVNAGEASVEIALSVPLAGVS